MGIIKRVQEASKRSLDTARLVFDKTWGPGKSRNPDQIDLEALRLKPLGARPHRVYRDLQGNIVAPPSERDFERLQREKRERKRTKAAKFARKSRRRNLRHA